MSINGTTASSSNSISCGVQSLTLSVPTPTTNPSSGITYSWFLPSGWSGSSTSNTINVTTSAGGSGNIVVQAQRNDVSCIQESYLIGVTRPAVGTPTITGLPTASLCVNDYVLLDGSATNAITYTYTTTGALNTLLAIWTSAAIQATSGGSSGTVTLTVDNSCLSPKSVTGTIYVGPPAITSATVDWLPLAYPNYINNPGFLTINVNNAVGSSTNWTLLNGSGNIYYAGQNQVSVCLSVYAG